MYKSTEEAVSLLESHSDRHTHAEAKPALLSQQAPEQIRGTDSLENISNICHLQKGTGPDVANPCSNKHGFSR